MRNQSDLDMVEKDDGILSSQASSAITNAFGMLQRERDVTVGGGASLEDIVTQIMKPLLAQWLDEHTARDRRARRTAGSRARCTQRRRPPQVVAPKSAPLDKHRASPRACALLPFVISEFRRERSCSRKHSVPRRGRTPL
jgi:hypothetical protein